MEKPPPDRGGGFRIRSEKRQRTGKVTPRLMPLVGGA